MNDLVQQDNGLVSKMQVAEEARAVEEIRAALMIAKRFARNEINSRALIKKSCERLSLAEAAIYSYPRGGQQVTGPSIHLAKMLARHWGNIQCGVREIESNEAYTIVEAYAWDMETNYRPSRIFKVKHERSTKKGTFALTDSRDIYELTANMGARRLRACLLDLIPTDIIEEAMYDCENTLKKGDGTPIEARIVKLIQAFETLGVNREMLEARLMHKIEVTNAQEFAELQKVYLSIKDGYATREKYFTLPTTESNAAELNSALKSSK